MLKSLLVILLVVALIWAWQGFRRLQLGQPSSRGKAKTDKNRQENPMVQCVQCKTYIPHNDAVSQGELNFCSTQHLEDWNQST